MTEIHLTLSEKDKQLLAHLLPEVSQALWIIPHEVVEQKVHHFAFSLGIKMMSEMRMPLWGQMFEKDENE